MIRYLRNVNLSTVVIIIIGILSSIVFYNTPFSGDDWAYLGAFEGNNAVCTDIISYIKWAGSHWLYNNGRAANLVMTFFLSGSKLFLSVICAVMTSLLYYMAMKMSTIKSDVFKSMLFILSIILVLPWWDSMYVFDCQFNYIWASALVLLSLSLSLSLSVTRSKSASSWKILLLAVVCVVSGMMHEAASMPICIGLFVYAVINKKKPKGVQKILIYSFVLGTALVTFAPGIISRAGAGTAPDDPLIWLLLKSGLLAFLLVLVCVVMSMFRRGRVAVLKLVHSKMIIFVVASFVSMVIGLASGVVGRSGLFAELYALIAIAGWASMFKFRLHEGLKTCITIILAVIIVAYYLILAIWQVKLGKENEKFMDLYRGSKDGIVFMDYTRDNEIPIVTLNRLRGIPDPDDVYLNKTFAIYNSVDTIIPIVLPTQVRNLDIKNLNGEVLLDCGDIIGTQLPAETFIHSTDREKIPMYLYDRDGEQWVVRPFKYGGRELYHMSKRIVDPGDR